MRGSHMTSLCPVLCVCMRVRWPPGQWARGSGTCTGEWGETWWWRFSGEGGPWLGARSRAGRESCLKFAVWHVAACPSRPAPGNVLGSQLGRQHP